MNAELAGIPVGALTVAVWGVAGSLAVLGAVLVGPSRPAAFAPLVFLLLPGLAAGLAGRFRADLADTPHGVRDRVRGDLRSPVLGGEQVPGVHPVLLHPRAAALAAPLGGVG